MAARSSAARRPSGDVAYLDIYRAAPVERIRMIKHGVRAAEAKRILADLDLGQGAAFQALALSPATVNRKAAQDQTLSPDESERVLGVARLIGQLQAMVQDAGGPADFDAAAWLSRWLQEPVPALGGVRPVEFMDTMEGQALVAETLARAQSGAYA